MKRMVLLDANLLIGAFDHDCENPRHVQARQHMAQLLNDPEIRLAITPLIRYEVLRGIKNIDAKTLTAILNDFEEFDIRERDATRAAEIFRLARKQNVPLDKRQFDLFHCVCAENNRLEFTSQDGDIPKIRKLMSET